MKVTRLMKTENMTTTTQQVHDENPDMKITEISKVLGARWRVMDEKQKAPYQKRADADKARLVSQEVAWDKMR